MHKAKPAQAATGPGQPSLVYNDPLKNAIYRSPKEDWSDLPLNKTLRGAPPNCGLPIGNLTSQLFGNIYLNPLDHFIKRELKLTLHPKKIYLQPVTNGFPFPGAFILPYRTYPGRRIVGNFRRAIMQPDKDPQKQENRITSYKGLFSHFDCYKMEKMWIR